MAKSFLPYDLDQQMLLPVDMREWLPQGHLALFIVDVVATLDLSTIVNLRDGKDTRGRAGFHPLMMVSLLLYAYCIGKSSSRKIEKACYEDVAFRVLSGNLHPDHDSISTFRQRHLNALNGLFRQVLMLCNKAGLVKLGHVAIDGTKIQANASKHKAMSYERMITKEKELEDEVVRLLAKAQEIDAEEDALYGKGKTGDELPEELKRRESRLRKIQEAKAALEEEAREAAQEHAKEQERKIEERARKERETGNPARGKDPEVPNPDEARPSPNAQRNFTDPDSRIMPASTHKGSFVQAYNAQIAVDDKYQIIVAASITQQSSDKQQLVSVVEQILESYGRLPPTISADSGYFSEAAVTSPIFGETNLLIPPPREIKKEGTKRKSPSKSKKTSSQLTAAAMRTKLGTPEAKDLYRMRKAIVEPVFGQIKEIRGFRRFFSRGTDRVSSEFSLIALTHNLLKLYRYAVEMVRAPATA
jgi:transposase